MTLALTEPAKLTLDETEVLITVEGSGYRLLISKQQPTMELILNGKEVVTLNLASGLDTVDAFDGVTELDPPVVRYEAGRLPVISWSGRSQRWTHKQVELELWPDGFSYGYNVTGSGILDQAHFWRTHFEGSRGQAVRLFSPSPNSGRVYYSGDQCPPNQGCDLCYPDPQIGNRFGSPDFMTISLGREKIYHGGNWIFSPAPFCYALEGAGNWLALGVAAAPGEWNFSDMHYPGDGFGFSLVYDGHYRVQDYWQSPRILCLVAANEYEAVQRYCDELRTRHLTPDHGRGPAYKWWHEPIFCGWGEQVSQEVHLGTPKAAGQATQANYCDWLATLEEHELNPGTVVIDDKWQLDYGLNQVDLGKWPDLPGFIAQQRRKNRHVLLWLKAWDPEGLPAEECILNAAGLPVAVDPTSPRYRRRFFAQVRYMLQNLGADGFKVDFTHMIPRGPELRQLEALKQRNQAAGLVTRANLNGPVGGSAGGKWGLELMREWLKLLSEATRAARPEALIITQTANPYLADLVDVLRLNDIAGLPDVRASVLPDMQRRARIARSASPFWLLDSDNWPCSTREQWRDYIQAQATGELGIPALYHATRLGWGRCDEELTEEDYAAIRQSWAAYRQKLAGKLSDFHPVEQNQVLELAPLLVAGSV